MDIGHEPLADDDANRGESLIIRGLKTQRQVARCPRLLSSASPHPNCSFAIEDSLSHNISRRTFVATAAVAGASAVLRAPAFAFENQSPGKGVATGATPKGREVVPLQAVPFPM